MTDAFMSHAMFSVEILTKWEVWCEKGRLERGSGVGLVQQEATLR